MWYKQVKWNILLCEVIALHEQVKVMSIVFNVLKESYKAHYEVSGVTCEFVIWYWVHQKVALGQVKWPLVNLW